MKFKEMVLVRIKIDENRNEQVIILKEKEGSRHLPMVIGMAEVNAIKLPLSGIDTPRPLTHDLLLQTASSLGGKLSKVLIDKLKDNTFYAKLIFARDGQEITVDARPSDSVALAIRAKKTIYCSDEVLQTAGMEEI